MAIVTGPPFSIDAVRKRPGIPGSFSVSAVIEKTQVPTLSIAITWDAWYSHNQFGTFKHEVVHLRRDSTSGAILATSDPQGGGGDLADTSSGHQFHATGSFTDTAPTTGHYVLSIVSINGAASLFSDSRVFTLDNGKGGTASNTSQSGNVSLGTGNVERLFTSCDLSVTPAPLTVRAWIAGRFRLDAEIRNIKGPFSFTVAAIVKATRIFGETGTEIVRPISDITSTGVNYSSGSTGWSLVDEAVLDTGDWYRIGSRPGFMYHQFSPSALSALGRTIVSVTLNTWDFNPPIGGNVDYRLRDPATSNTYTILARGQDNTGGSHATASAAQTSRPWGGAWTIADVAQLQAGGTANDFSNPNLTIYQFYLGIAYSYAGGIVVNAVKKKTQTSSFLIRAVIKKTFNPTFGVQYVWKSIVTGSFTTNAVVKRTMAGSFTVAAVRQKGQSGNFTVAAVQKKTQIGPPNYNFTIEAEKTGTAATFSLAAVLQRVGTPFVGNLVFPGTPLPLGGVTGNAHSPAIPIAAGSYVDVVLVTPPSDGGSIGVFDSATSDFVAVSSPTAGYYRFTPLGGSYVVFSALATTYRPLLTGAGSYIDYARSTHTFTLGAAVLYFRIYAEIRDIKTGSFTLRALVQTHRAGSLGVRAVRKATQARTFGVQYQWVPAHFLVRAFVQPWFFINAQIVHRILGSFPIAASKAGRIRLNAVIKKNQSGPPRQFVVAAQKVVRHQASFTLNAFVLSQFTMAATVHIHHTFQAPNRGIRVNASKAFKRIATFTLDAWLRPAFTIRAVVKREQSGSFLIDAEHRNIKTGSFTLNSYFQTYILLNAVVRWTWAASFSVEASSAIRRTGSFTLSARVKPYFYVNAVIRRPAAFAPALVFRLFAEKGPRLVSRSFPIRTEIYSPGAYWDPIDETWRWLGFTADAMFSRHSQRSFTIRARMFAPGNADTSMDAVVQATVYPAFRLEAEKAVDLQTRSGSFTLNAWKRGIVSRNFHLNAELVGRTKRGSFALNATSVNIGGRLGIFSLDAEVLGTRTSAFRLFAEIALPYFYLDALIFQPHFSVSAYVAQRVRLDALIKRIKAGSFTLDYQWLRPPRIGSFHLDGFVGAVGQHYGLMTLAAVRLATRSTDRAPFLPYIWLSSYIRRLASSFTVSAYKGHGFKVNAFIQPHFALNAYIQGTNIIVWPPDGGPPTFGPGGPPVTGGGKVSRKFRIRIELGIVDTDTVNHELALELEHQAATLATYINTYERIPEDARTPDQQSALETDRESYAAVIKRYQAALEPDKAWTDYTGDVMWQSASFTQAARTGIGSFGFTLQGIHPELRGGEEIHLFVDDRRVFGGYVTNIEYQYNFSSFASPRTVVTGVDYNILFDRLAIYNVLWEFENFDATGGTHAGEYHPLPDFPVGTPDVEIISRVMADCVGFNAPSDLDVTTGIVPITTPATEVNWVLPNSGNPLRVVFQEISRITSGIWYIDAEKVLRYHDRLGIPTAPQPITDGYGGISTRDLGITLDTSTLENDIFVWGLLQQNPDLIDDAYITYAHELGDGQAMVRYYEDAVEEMQGYIDTYEALPSLTKQQQKNLATDRQTLATDKAELAYWQANPEIDSVGQFGRSQYGEPRQDIFHQKWLTKRAFSILRRYQQPIMKAEATIYEPYYAAGQRVQLISREWDIDATLVINQITITFAVPKEPEGSTWFAFPQYRVTMGLNPEDPWNIYDYLPLPGENEAGTDTQDSSSSNPGSGHTSGGANAKGVAQRRFWNAMTPTLDDGVIAISSWDGLENCELLASQDGCDWEHVYDGSQFLQTKTLAEPWFGFQPFPTRFKLYRYWRLAYKYPGVVTAGSQSFGGLDINEFIFMPYSTDLSGARWDRGDPTDNLFYTSSPIWRSAGHPETKVRYEAHVHFRDPQTKDIVYPSWTMFGGPSNGAYGYLNDVYFGWNQFGGNKPNVGIGPKINAVGDLSKSYSGLWGAFGIADGIPNMNLLITAEWTFDLCDEPSRVFAKVVGNPNPVQSEGWGSEWCVADLDGIFETRATPQRSTLTVYDIEGGQLHDGIHYEPLEGDKSGRKYKLLVTPKIGAGAGAGAEGDCNPFAGGDENAGFGGHVGEGGTEFGESPSLCDLEGVGSHVALAVTYLVSPATISQVRTTKRQTNPGVTHDRLRMNDIRGL